MSHRRNRTRRPLLPLVALLGLLAALLAPASPALAAFTATLAGSAATLSGDIADDITTIDVMAGLLHHNRFSSGDPNFMDNFDFDTRLAGSQHLAATPGATVNIDAGGGNDTIFVSDLAAATGITININGGAGDDQIRPGRQSRHAQYNAGYAGSDTVVERIIHKTKVGG